MKHLKTAKEDLFDNLKKIRSETESHIMIYVVGDYGYWDIKLMQELKKINVNFLTRIRSDMLVEYKGSQIKIKNISKLLNTGSKESKTIAIKRSGFELFVTLIKKYNRHGEVKNIYVISNYKQKSSNIYDLYSTRYKIEFFHRFLKQHLGYNDCLAKSLAAQRKWFNILNFIYSFIDDFKNRKKLETLEKSIRLIQKKTKNFIKKELLKFYKKMTE